jgi:nucleoside-diphosphate-sugar epimerase
LLKNTIAGHDAIIHLACISNDPSFELNPELGKSINLDAFEPLVRIAKESGVKRFIYASSSSVYGIKDKPEVTEDMVLEPLTDYSKFKAMCEEILAGYQSPEFTTVTIRPATVCGYSPRLRLDLTVNILTNLAVNKGEITVFGGQQKRPNLHIEDMAALYLLLLELPDDKIAGKVFNAGYENHTVSEIAGMVRTTIGPQVQIVTSVSNDNRSYHISSAKIKREIGFVPTHSITDAIQDLKNAFDSDLIPNSLTDARYFNVKQMQNINLS